ncbi:MAG TPA: ankyrin repeat domain-containing protein [Blastocatellia bacterium]|nr:ankyrin repeat domain-containing protein [Blastocatellia bacterium]
MKRAITFVSVICFCCTLLMRADAQQKRQRRQKASRPPGAVSLDGKWTGKTEQNNAITFTVLKGRITEFSAEGRFQGYGCSTTSNTTTTINQPIVNKAFSFSARGGPGGVSLRVNGTFTSSTTSQGVASMELHPIPGPPPGVPGHVPSCGGSLRTTWIAWKGDREPSGEIPPLPKGPVASKRARPPLLELISPKEGDVLDNGCDNFKEPIVWEFRWSEARGAQRYHLYVIHEFAGNPVIDNPNIKSTSYTDQSKGFIPTQSLAGWRWKVRPMVKGVWKDWSDEQTFSVEPENKDCRDSAALLLQAVENGDGPRVKELLSQEWSDANRIDSKGRTALVVAARAGQTEIVRLLLAAGAQVNRLGGGDNQAALSAAAQGGHTEVVQALLEAGADVNSQQFGSDKTALYYAAESGHVETVKALLQKGAGPNGRGSSHTGAYPLIAAIEKGHLEVARTLLQAGANPNVERTNWNTLSRQTALQIAKAKGFSEIAQLLRQHGARE